MKNFGIISAVIMLSVLLQSCRDEEGKRVKGNAVITFTQTKYDYGKIPFRGDGDCEFPFRNTGTEPLIIIFAKSTCGCTIPDWTVLPIKAGEQGIIKVNYDTRQAGTFNKSIYVYSNANNGVQRLYIRGTVNPYDEESVN